MEIREEWREFLEPYADRIGIGTLFGEPLKDATTDELRCIVGFLGAELERDRMLRNSAAEFRAALTEWRDRESTPR